MSRPIRQLGESRDLARMLLNECLSRHATLTRLPDLTPERLQKLQELEARIDELQRFFAEVRERETRASQPKPSRAMIVKAVDATSAVLGGEKGSVPTFARLLGVIDYLPSKKLRKQLRKLVREDLEEIDQFASCRCSLTHELQTSIDRGLASNCAIRL